MANEENETLVPKLRFPAFRKTKGWRIATLASVLTEERLTSDGKSEVHSVSLTKGVVPQIEHMGRSFSASDTSHYSLVRPFDVIYTKSPLAIFKLGIVKQHRGPHNAIVSPLYGVFTPVNRYVGQLIEAYFDSPSRSMNYLDPLCQKGAKNTIQISNNRFLSGEICLPSEPAEQQKIASFLTSLDELIAEQSRKVDSLREHKRGLMQQLFPREGETQPRLRFPEFQNKGEWSEEKLTEIAKTTIGLVTTMTTSYASKGVPLIRNSDIKENTVRKGKLIYLLESFADKHSNKKLIEGDIVTVHTGDIGVSAVIDRDLSGCLGFATLNTRLLNRDVSPEYLCWYFNSERYIRFALSMATGDGRNNFNLSDFNLSVIPIPSKAEQQRIATCLSSLDALITAETQKHEALKTHKKGLMQQLFPSLEEVEA